MTDTIIQQAQSGDKQAFEVLINQYYDTMYRFAYKWCANSTNAQDITQLAAIKLARTIVQFRFEASFTSWLYRLVINCAKDWQKSQQRHTTDPWPEPDHEPPVASGSEHSILLGQLLVKLDQAGDGIKETVLLVHAEGLSHKEAANVLAVKESTISWRIHHMRKTLAPWFGEHS